MQLGPYSSDKKLVKAIQKGDQTAFEFLFKQYYGPIVGYITTFTQDKELSEDIVQHSFISLWQKRHQLSKDLSPKNYLYTIAHNRYIDLYRKQKRSHNLIEELRLENLRNRIDEDKDFLDQRITKLKKIIDKLPPRCKKILYMSRIRGLAYIEIAEKLQISPKTVEKQIRIAFKKIREGIDPV